MSLLHYDLLAVYDVQSLRGLGNALAIEIIGSDIPRSHTLRYALDGSSVFVSKIAILESSSLTTA